MENKPIICIGASLVDEIFTGKKTIEPGTSNPSTLFKSPGGVARNIASHLARLGHRVELISHIGNDVSGDWLLKQCKSVGIGIQHIRKSDEPTGCFTAINHPNGQMFVGASVSSIETEVTPDYLESKSELLSEARLLVIDCNLSTECINWILRFTKQNKLPSIIEPVSVPKARKLSSADLSHTLMISPNEMELCAIAETENLNSAIEKVHARGLKHLWMRSGAKGSTIYSNGSTIHLAAPNAELQDTTGSGDAALAGWIHGWLIGAKPEECLRMGHALAGIAISVGGAEIPELNKEKLMEVYNAV